MKYEELRNGPIRTDEPQLKETIVNDSVMRTENIPGVGTTHVKA